MNNQPTSTSSPEYQSSCNMDSIWALSRLPPTKLFDIDQSRDDSAQVVPSWGAFNSLVFAQPCLPSVIGYFPMISGNSTELSTIYTVMKKAQKVCAHFKQRDVVITFDLTIYAKAKEIQFKFRIQRHCD